jgi:hypothetical protein
MSLLTPTDGARMRILRWCCRAMLGHVATNPEIASQDSLAHARRRLILWITVTSES